MKVDLLAAINAARLARKPVAVITHLKSGEQRLVHRSEAGAGSALEKAFRFDKSGIEGEEFIAIHNPPLRLVIVGAVLISQSIIPIAQACGYDVTVIDPRGAFATGARFPNIKLVAEWPEDVLPGMGLDGRTGLVALTHDPKIDDPALQLALSSQLFYIGALGSKKTQAARRERLQRAGFDEAALARICGPIGLNIGAVGAAEIAISVMAEMTKVLRLGLA